MRATHSAAPITRLMGAKRKDRAWRNRLNRGFDKDLAIGEGREWIGNMGDPLPVRGKAWTEGGFSPSTHVGVLASEASLTFSSDTDIT